METFTETVYPAEWPGFPGETDARQQARADLRVVEELSQERTGPAWPTISEIYKREEAEAFEAADKSPIYDYEIEMQRPLQPVAQVAKKISLRQRAKRLMGKTSDTLRDVSIAAFAVAQAKSEELKEYYADQEAGKRRRAITGGVMGALVVGATAYLNSKGVSSGSPHSRASEVASLKPQFSALNHVHHTVEAPRHIVTVHDGQNPWSISEHHLQAQGNIHPSEAQIASYDQKLAHANPDVYTYGDNSAEYIQAGTKLRLP